MDPHRLAEERSIALHRAIAAKLRADPRLVERARARVAQWRNDRSTATGYVDAWERLLTSDIDLLCEALVDRGQEARALRQTSPFAGFLEPRERWRLWRLVRAEVEVGASAGDPTR